MIRFKNIKSYMMPISMIIGIIFYKPLSQLSSVTQYLIFVMLLISYTNLSFKNIRFSKLHLYLLSIQIIGSILTYLLFQIFDPIIAEGSMICVLAPTATSAIVITGMLGGNTASLTTYSLLSNIVVAAVAPIFFSLLNNNPDVSFWKEFTEISQKVFILLLLPFILGILVNKFSPQLANKIKANQSISFFIWNAALIIVTARTVQFLIQEGTTHLRTVIILFFVIFIICSLQFIIGRKLGSLFNDTIAGGQGLGQKNTILSIWMAQTFLNPLSSIGPSAYILWQNIINSYQVWRKQHKKPIS